MNHVEISNQLLMEELLSLDALLKLMKGREPSEWMLNNVMSLLYSLKSRAFLAKKLSMADIIHFMQKVLIELPFYAALDLLLKSVEACVKAFEEVAPTSLVDDLILAYEDCVKAVFASPVTQIALVRK